MPHVIITGGSSGIGAAIAELYAARGARITLIARANAPLAETADRLADLYRQSGVLVGAQSADVFDAEALACAIGRSEQRFGPCDVLVTSAGVVRPARFADLACADFEAQININLIGTANAVRAAYPGMEQRRRGTILMVSSGAGLMGIYGYAAYCASKFAVRGFAEALRFEARAAGIHVAVCYPPDTETPQLRREIPLRPPEAQAIIGRDRPWTAAQVARHAIKGLERGRFSICFGLQLHLLHRFGSLAMPILRFWFDRKIAAATGASVSRH